jgi:limonene-1,2-epoxide hydrolase
MVAQGHFENSELVLEEGNSFNEQGDRRWHIGMCGILAVGNGSVIAWRAVKKP